MSTKGISPEEKGRQNLAKIRSYLESLSNEELKQIEGTRASNIGKIRRDHLAEILGISKNSRNTFIKGSIVGDWLLEFEAKKRAAGILTSIDGEAQQAPAAVQRAQQKVAEKDGEVKRLRDRVAELEGQIELLKNQLEDKAHEREQLFDLEIYAR